MATKLPGETYRGNTLHVPLSADGQIALYVWPLRMLSIRGRLWRSHPRRRGRQ
mgnify:CR=1 FL=1